MSDRRSPQNHNPLLLAAATILNLGNYSASYGSLTAAIGPMMWMSMSLIMVPCGGGGAVMADARAPAVSTIERTLALRINIDAKVATLGGSANTTVPEYFCVFPGGGSSDLKA